MLNSSREVRDTREQGRTVGRGTGAVLPAVAVNDKEMRCVLLHTPEYFIAARSGCRMSSHVWVLLEEPIQLLHQRKFFHVVFTASQRLRQAMQGCRTRGWRGNRFLPPSPPLPRQARIFMTEFMKGI